MDSRTIARKLGVALALFAVLASSLLGVVQSLTAAEVAACCATSCPMHRHAAQDSRRGGRNCDSHGASGADDCSMRACRMPANPAIGAGEYILRTPLDPAYVLRAEPAPVSNSIYLPSRLDLPSTPPPRTFPS